MRKLIFGLLVFIAGVSLGWYAQRYGADQPREAGSPVTPAPAPTAPEMPCDPGTR